ncbi:hypothetical protein D5018_06450 [Parashewanella curva]|uniref:DUF4189 domain-containing protein n=1 Tax=Parashewanella curva TaxID=2338552 RepID=A0A3L8PYY2_9GAMM|nr:hypothetical protein [Parashewanella curva]RLV60584.1 hypothetical protein D5018_06450 [Parashewanella curva]
MKYTLVLLLSLCVPTLAQAQTKDQQIEQLKQEVKSLKHQLRKLKQGLNQPTDSTQTLNINRNANRTQWGCYLDDVKAGNFYGTGSTEAEARGKALQKCSAKGGACFDIDVKCSQSN